MILDIPGGGVYSHARIVHTHYYMLRNGGDDYSYRSESVLANQFLLFRCLGLRTMKQAIVLDLQYTTHP